MTGHELDERAQSDFERSLFESARGDAPPPGATERAWRRFAADATALAPLAAAAGAPRGWSDGAAARAAKWTLIGALGGASLVAVWLRPPPLGEPALAPAPSAPETPAASPVDRGAPLLDLSAGTATAAASAAPALAAPPTARRSRRPPAPAAVSRTGTASSAESLLAREVAALDAARTALAVGANASALRQIERYHREFPQGELSSDADVVAIEALAAEGRSSATKRAAKRFLQQHPRDPHAARIRELAR